MATLRWTIIQKNRSIPGNNLCLFILRIISFPVPQSLQRLEMLVTRTTPDLASQLKATPTGSVSRVSRCLNQTIKPPATDRIVHNGPSDWSKRSL